MRRSPGRFGVNASVARTTKSAVTVPPTRHDPGPLAAPPRLDPRDLTVLEDRDAEPLDHVGEPAYESRRIDPRAVGCVRGAMRAAYVAVLVELAHLEPAQVALVDAERARGVHLVAKPRRLEFAAREVERATLDEPGVDAIVGERLTKFAHRVLEHEPLMRERVLAVLSDDAFPFDWKEGRRPAAVSTRRPKTAHRLLDDGDLQRGVATLQFTSGPQPRVTPADDGHVDVEVASQRCARLRHLVERGPPQRWWRFH